MRKNQHAVKKVLTEEEALFEKEGRGRFNLRRTSGITAVPPRKRTANGPRSVISNRPTTTVGGIGYDRTKYTPHLTQDEMGNDVRVMVPFKRKRRPSKAAVVKKK